MLDPASSSFDATLLTLTARVGGVHHRRILASLTACP